MRLGQGDRVRLFEEAAARVQFEEQDPQRVEVGAGSGSTLAPHELRRGVGEGSGEPPCGPSLQLLGVGGQPEVHERDLLLPGSRLADDHVLALEIGVNQAARMEEVERATELDHDPGLVLEGPAGESFEEGAPFHVLHREPGSPRGLAAAEVVDRDDVGMPETAEPSELALEALTGRIFDEGRRLQRDEATTAPAVLGQVDRAHPTRAQGSPDEVATRDARPRAQARVAGRAVFWRAAIPGRRQPRRTRRDGCRRCGSGPRCGKSRGCCPRARRTSCRRRRPASSCSS